MDNSGFIKISRKILEWEWYDDPNVCKVWIHLLLKVNWKDGNYHGQKIKAGQHITSVRKLAKECGLTYQQTRTALAKLKSTHEITLNQRNVGTMITVIKWEEYQSVGYDTNAQSTQDLTQHQRTTNAASTHQYRRKKEGKKEIIKNSESPSPNIYAPGWVDRSGKTRKELEAELNELLNPKRDS